MEVILIKSLKNLQKDYLTELQTRILKFIFRKLMKPFLQLRRLVCSSKAKLPEKALN